MAIPILGDRRRTPRPWEVLSGPEMVFVLVAAVLGGAAQSVLGFGAAFTTVPAIAIVAPELIPGAALLSFLPLTGIMALRERTLMDRPAAFRICVARVPGILLGTAAVKVLDADDLATGVAIVMLGAVVSAGLGWSVAMTPTSERIAGVISGFSGTAVGLGGPPLAVLFRDRPPQQSRPTLAVVFTIGILLSTFTLAVTGSLTWNQVTSGAVIAVGLMAGLVLASPLLARLSDKTIRGGLLVWAGSGSAVALLRVVLR
ncbi:MAG: sulfite exporter TauE/SafE family protein [Euzebya sp.]